MTRVFLHTDLAQIASAFPLIYLFLLKFSVSAKGIAHGYSRWANTYGLPLPFEIFYRYLSALEQ